MVLIVIWYLYLKAIMDLLKYTECMMILWYS